MKKKVVIFISGSGSNMEALIKASQQNDFPANIVAVISDNENALGMEKAKKLGVSAHCILRKDYQSKIEFEQAILQCLDGYKPDILCLAGYMRLISSLIITPYEGRILNIHPSLLPLFKGLDTHQRAIDAGMKVGGCTVHLVTEGMDEGKILGQAVVPILNNDTSKILAERILTVEHQLYAKTLRAFIEDGAPIIDTKQHIISF